MVNGKLEQYDTPFDLFHRPENKFVANFIGEGMFLEGICLEDDFVELEIGKVKGGESWPYSRGEKLMVFLRPDDILYSPESRIFAKINASEFRGTLIQYTIELESGNHLLFVHPSHKTFEVGQKIPISFDLKHLVVFKI